MRSLRIICALFRKNNSQPGFFATIWLLLLALIVPAIDFFHRVPAVAWLGSIGWLCFLGMSAGAGSFAIDTKHQSTRFLEYLPIRRWQIWLGNFGDGFVWLVGTILIASAYRTMHWIAPAPNAWGNIDEIEETLFRGRFSLMLAMMGFTLCAFSVSTFYRTITERDMSAIVRAVVASMLIIGMVAALPQFVGISPGADEMAIPLLVIAAGYALASLLLFVLPLRHWHGFFRWLIRSWFASALYVLTLGTIYVFALQWVRYEPQASDRLNCPVLASGINAVQVWSRRSGPHLLDVNLNTGQFQYVGRGVSAFKIVLPEEAKSLTFVTSLLSPVEEWMNRSGFFRSAGHEQAVSGFPNEMSLAATGEAYNVRGKLQGLDGQTFVCEGTRRRQSRAPIECCVCDARGRIAWHVPMAPDGDILLRADGVALFCAPGPDPVPYSVNHSLVILMNVRSGEQTKVQLPGQLLDCAPDLSACVCLVYDTRNEVTYRRLVVVELPGGKQRASIGEDQLPPVPYVPPSNSGYSQYIRSFRHDFGAAYFEDLGLMVDDSYQHLVWTAALNEPPGTVGIRVFDLQSGENRTLVSPADLGTRKSLRASIPHLIGITPNADAVLYETSQGIHRVTIDGSSHQIIAKHPDNVSSVNWSFSPDRSRVIGERHRDEGDDESRDYVRLLELWENGNSTELYAAQNFSHPWWLNDREVAWDNDREILIFDVQTRTRRCAFSVDDLLKSAASHFTPHEELKD